MDRGDGSGDPGSPGASREGLTSGPAAPIRLPSQAVMTVVRSRDPALGLDLEAAARAQDRLYRHMAGLLGTPWVTRAAWLAGRWLGVVVTGPQRHLASETLDGPLVWGLPIGAAGAATDEEVAAAAREPAAARRLDGPFALLAATPAGARLTTGAYLVHAVQEASGPQAEAWSTKGLAALVAAGVPARINDSAVAEYVTMDYVLGDEELLAGVRALPEALVVDIRREGARRDCYWPLAERFGAASPTGAADLRAAAGEVMARAGNLPGAHLAMTAGRDSMLLASCAAGNGAAPAAFTIGTPQTPDVIGARAVAEQLGWPHVLLGAGPARSDASIYGRVTAGSIWTEGLDTAWNLAAPALHWTGPGDVAWLSGSGGEIGRAFYWSWALPEAGDVDVLTGGVCRHMSAPAQARLRERAAAAVHDAGAATGRNGRDRLDVIYARGRMRKWLERSLPRPESRGTFAAYLAPPVVNALMNIPPEAKRSGAVFDEALRGMPDLAAVARHAVSAATPAAQAGRRRSLRALAGRVPYALDAAERVRSGPLIVRLAARTGEPGVQLFQRVSAERGGRELRAEEMLGRQWWRSVQAGAPRSATSRRWMWNALAVDALADAIASLPAPAAPLRAAREAITVTGGPRCAG